MKKAYINLPAAKTAASDYMIKIVYDDGKILEKKITSYSYSDVFDWIKENHEGEYDRKTKSINIEVIEMEKTLEYKDYNIKVSFNNNIYEAIGIKGGYRESSHGDTEGDAIKHG